MACPTLRGSFDGGTGGSQSGFASVSLASLSGGALAAGDVILLWALQETATSESFTAYMGKIVTGETQATSESVINVTDAVSGTYPPGDQGALILDTMHTTYIPAATTITAVTASSPSSSANGSYTLSANASTLGSGQNLVVMPAAFTQATPTHADDIQATFLYYVVQTADVTAGLNHVVVISSTGSNQWAFVGAVYESGTISTASPPSDPPTGWTSSGTGSDATSFNAASISTDYANTLLIYFAGTSIASGGTPQAITAPSGFSIVGSQYNTTETGAHTNVGAAMFSMVVSGSNPQSYNGSVTTADDGAALLIGLAALPAAGSGLLMASGLL